MNAKNLKVLLVDDEPLVLEMFGYALEESACEVVTAASFEESSALIARQVFDVVVCDVRLEASNGFDVAALARRRSSETAIVIVTGYPELSDRLMAIELGYSFLAKPLNLHTLTYEVHRAVLTQAEPWGAFRDHQSIIPQQYLL